MKNITDASQSNLGEACLLVNMADVTLKLEGNHPIMLFFLTTVVVRRICLFFVTTSCKFGDDHIPIHFHGSLPLDFVLLESALI